MKHELKWLGAFPLRLVAVLLCLGAKPDIATAREFKWLDLDHVSVKAARFGCNREPMTPQYSDCKDYLGRASFEIGLRILEVGYWDNYVHTEGIESQVKTVGWHWELGMHITKYADLFYEHHSRHVMEGEQPRVWLEDEAQLTRQPYPLEDSYGIRFKFWVNPNPARSWLE